MTTERMRSGWGIEWHKANLVNKRKYYEQQVAELNKMIADVAKTKMEIEAKELQIQRAEKESRDGFDDEKYKPMKGTKQ